jgi:hypothetical protein
MKEIVATIDLSSSRVSVAAALVPFRLSQTTTRNSLLAPARMVLRLHEKMRVTAIVAAAVKVGRLAG